MASGMLLRRFQGCSGGFHGRFKEFQGVPVDLSGVSRRSLEISGGQGGSRDPRGFQRVYGGPRGASRSLRKILEYLRDASKDLREFQGCSRGTQGGSGPFSEFLISALR